MGGTTDLGSVGKGENPSAVTNNQIQTPLKISLNNKKQSFKQRRKPSIGIFIFQ